MVLTVIFIEVSFYENDRHSENLIGRFRCGSIVNILFEQPPGSYQDILSLEEYQAWSPVSCGQHLLITEQGTSLPQPSYESTLGLTSRCIKRHNMCDVRAVSNPLGYRNDRGSKRLNIGDRTISKKTYEVVCLTAFDLGLLI